MYPFLSRRYPVALHRGIIMLFHNPEWLNVLKMQYSNAVICSSDSAPIRWPPKTR
jgi:hypothetical protein